MMCCVAVLRPGLVKGPWTKEEDDVIIQCMTTGITKWSEIADRIPGRLGKQVRPSPPAQVDALDASCTSAPTGCRCRACVWGQCLACCAPVHVVLIPVRCWLRLQCRERWLNHLDPNLKKGEWSKEEDAILLDAQAKWGNAWTRIADLLPGRYVVKA